MVAGTADGGEHHDQDGVRGEGEQDGAKGMTHPSILSAFDRRTARHRVSEPRREPRARFNG
ncbi:hypothetical protein GCM10023087_27550 [Microbacterium rhizosphaerae]